MKKINVDKMSLKEAAEYVIKKLVIQGEQCFDGDECAYGNEFGQHCAVGFLLNEKNKYLMELQGSVYTLISEESKSVPKLIKNNTEFFRELQNFHDENTLSSRSIRLKKLKSIAPHAIDLRNPNWKKWVNLGIS